MYSHTMGPKDTPNMPINKNKPTKTSASPIALSSDPLFKKNPIPTSRQLTPYSNVPTCRIVFLPNFTNRIPVAKVPMTCSKLIRLGMRADSSPVVALDAMSPP